MSQIIGVIVIKGESLHVNKLSVEKGELDVDGRVDSLVYSQNSISMKKGDSLVNRLFR